MVSGVLIQKLTAPGLEIHIQMAYNLTNIFLSMYSLYVQNFRESEQVLPNLQSCALSKIRVAEMGVCLRNGQKCLFVLPEILHT